jgi:hypothetical protein
MKTTIEVHGYQITIDEMHDKIQVTAEKEGETVEEFTLEVEEGFGEDDDMGMKKFGAEEEEDFGDEDFDEEGEEMEEMEEGDDDMEDEDMEEDKEAKTLESFAHFVRRRRK